jgi:hypothetical protein
LIDFQNSAVQLQRFFLVLCYRRQDGSHRIIVDKGKATMVRYGCTNNLGLGLGCKWFKQGPKIRVLGTVRKVLDNQSAIRITLGTISKLFLVFVSAVVVVGIVACFLVLLSRSRR